MTDTGTRATLTAGPGPNGMVTVVSETPECTIWHDLTVDEARALGWALVTWAGMQEVRPLANEAVQARRKGEAKA